MPVNHVELNGSTVLDLRHDTVSPQQLLTGVTAHDAAGNDIVGQYTPIVLAVAQHTMQLMQAPVVRTMTVTGHKLAIAPATVQGNKVIT